MTPEPMRPLANMPLRLTSASLASVARPVTGERKRYLDSSRSGQLALSSYTRCPEVVSR